MRPLRPASALVLALATAACGRVEIGELPEEATFAITAPDDSAAGTSPLCASGDATYKDGLKKELEELNIASRPYRELYRLARLADAVQRRSARIARRQAAAQEAGAAPVGSFDRTFTGPNGTVTISVDVQEDGSRTVQVTAQKKTGDDSDAAPRVVFEGHIAEDNLSGAWTIFGKDGTAWRTITWTKTAAGDLSSQWKNEKNGKTATYTVTGTSARVVITKANGESADMQWDTVTKAGSLVHTSAGGREKAVCWDATFCDVACAQ